MTERTKKFTSDFSHVRVEGETEDELNENAQDISNKKEFPQETKADDQ